MSISFDVSAVADVNPWTLPAGLSAVKSTFRVGSGTIRSTFADGAMSLLRVTNPNTSGLLDVIWTSNQDSNGDGDVTGAYFGDLLGNGFIVRIFYDLVSVATVSLGVIGTQLTSASGLVFTPSPTFRATYDLATNNIRVYQQSAPATPIASVDGATPVANMGSGLITIADGDGDGIVSATMSSLVSQSLDDINTTEIVRVNSTGNTIATTGLATLTTLTIGGKSATSISAVGGDGTFSMPAFADTVAYSLMGTKTATAGDGTTTANLSVSLLPMTGWDYVTLSGTLNTTTTGVLNSFSPAAVVGDQIVFETVNGAVDAQGNFAGDPDIIQTMYHIKASDSVVRSYLVNTAPVTDTTPNAFTFTDITNATLATVYTSNTITISGIDAPAAISITGGTYSKNGGAYTGTSGTVVNGDTVAVRLTSSVSFNTNLGAVLTVGGVSDTYNVTTLLIDTVPTQFTFTDVTGALINVEYESNEITVLGINSPSTATITGGQYAVNVGSGFGAYTSSSTAIPLNATVKVKGTSSGTYGSGPVNVVFTMGGSVVDTFSITTRPTAPVVSTDTTPIIATAIKKPQRKSISKSISSPIAYVKQRDN